MKTLLLLCLALSCLPLDAAEKKPADAAYAELAWLIGGTWKATLPADKTGVSAQIEAVFTAPENKQGVSFTSAFVRAGKRSPYTAGMYAWDGAKQKLVMFYTDSSGSLTQGEAIREGETWGHEFTITQQAGKVQRARSRLTHASADVFINEIFLEQDGAWNRVVEARYERSR